jgi:hypothetical protein
MSGAGATTLSMFGLMSIRGTANKFLSQRALHIQDSALVEWLSTTPLTLSDGSTLDIQANASFRALSNAGIDQGGGSAASVVNRGSFTKQAGSGTTAIGVLFSNIGGRVEAASGRLSFAGGGSSSSGTIQIGAQGALEFTGAGTRFTVAPDTQMNGAGPLFVNGGAEMDPNANADLQDMYLDGDSSIFAGSGQVNIHGTLHWLAGTMSGSGTTAIVAGGMLDLTGDRQKYLRENRSLSIRSGGGGGWMGNGGVWGGGGSKLINEGNLMVDPVGAFRYESGTPSFTNNGTLVVTSGSTAFDAGVSFTNTGALDLESQDSRGALVVRGTLMLSGGTLTGPGLLTVSGDLMWTGGTMSGTGTTTLAMGSTLSIGGDADKTLDRRALDLLSATTWSGAGNLLLLNNAALINRSGAVFNIPNDASLLGGGTFNNFGVLTKNSTAGGTTTFGTGVAFSNNTGGTVNIQSGTLYAVDAYTQNGGDTALSAGAVLASDGLLNLLAGTLSGSGTINASVRNAGVINPGSMNTPGILTINGNYTQAAMGVLNIKIGGDSPGTGYDQLVINGQTSLGGTLNIRVIGTFTANTFLLLLFSSTDNTMFATVNFDPTVFQGVTYEATDVLLRTL